MLTSPHYHRIMLISMNKRRTPFFILGTLLIVACVVIIAILNVFALHGILRFAVIIVSFIVGLIFFGKLSLWAKKVSPKHMSADDARAAALSVCKNDIKDYLRQNQSTPFFREKLTAVSKRIDTFSEKCDNIKKVIIECFGSTSLSFAKFFAPVVELQEHLINQVNSLVLKMKVFNEEEYRRKINTLAVSKQQSEAEEYKAIEQEYKDFADKTLAAFDDSVLKLDKLALEISKLGEADGEKAMAIMHELDTVIEDTQFYK